MIKKNTRLPPKTAKKRCILIQIIWTDYNPNSPIRPHQSIITFDRGLKRPPRLLSKREKNLLQTQESLFFFIKVSWFARVFPQAIIGRDICILASTDPGVLACIWYRLIHTLDCLHFLLG